jgi:hypothetical protein
MSGKAVSAAFGAAVAVGLSFKILVNLLGKKTYDGLSGVISFSSKMIAGASSRRVAWRVSGHYHDDGAVGNLIRVPAA